MKKVLILFFLTIILSNEDFLSSVFNILKEIFSKLEQKASVEALFGS